LSARRGSRSLCCMSCRVLYPRMYLELSRISSVQLPRSSCPSEEAFMTECCVAIACVHAAECRYFDCIVACCSLPQACRMWPVRADTNASPRNHAMCASCQRCNGPFDQLALLAVFNVVNFTHFGNVSPHKQRHTAHRHTTTAHNRTLTFRPTTEQRWIRATK
jgi:hypothetical protein